MHRHWILMLGMVVGLLVGGSIARSQNLRPGIGQPVNPPYSPYLNLLRRNTPTYLNYYGLVRPELEFRGGIQNLQGEVFTNQQGIADLRSRIGDMAITGHPTRFLNTGNYFLSPTGGGAGPGLRGPRPSSAGLPSVPQTPGARTSLPTTLTAPRR